MPGRIAATLRILHGGPRFLRDFDMLALAARYQALAEQRQPFRPIARDVLDAGIRQQRDVEGHGLLGPALEHQERGDFGFHAVIPSTA